jgi:hypothetical protein
MVRLVLPRSMEVIGHNVEPIDVLSHLNELEVNILIVTSSRGDCK